MKTPIAFVYQFSAQRPITSMPRLFALSLYSKWHSSRAGFCSLCKFSKTLNFLFLQRICLARLFPDNLTRTLVLPETEKHRVPQPIIPRSFREFHFGNNDWFNPNAPFHFGGSQPRIKAAPGCRQIIKWAIFDGDLVSSAESNLKSFSLKPVPTRAANFSFPLS
jgi:hypothetical protein